MSVDPYYAPGGVGEPQGWNRYAYVLNDPVNLLDPNGLNYSHKVPYEGATPFGSGRSIFFLPGPPEYDGTIVLGNPFAQNRGSTTEGPPGRSAKRRRLPGEILITELEGGGDAEKALQDPDCANAIANGTPQAALSMLKDGIRIFAEDGGVVTPQGVRIARTDRFNVYVNANVFFDPRRAAAVSGTGDYLSVFAEQFHLDRSKLTAGNFQAIYLLHELGHLQGVFKNEGSDEENFGNTTTVISHCFKELLR
jgi:hypothetical protein